MEFIVIICIWFFIGLVGTWLFKIKPALRNIDFGTPINVTLVDILDSIMFILAGPILPIRELIDGLNDINLFKLTRKTNGKIKID